MSKKTRLDVAVFEHGYAESREKAKAIIMSGIVYVNNQKYDKAGTMIPNDATIEVRGKTLPFVSRGGLKLQKAIDVFNINLDNKICMDIGASTGGFTDCMLQHKAKKVYCVDVGYGQLAYKLRIDERVINLERTNVRYLDADKVKDSIDFASIDVSFISLRLVLPVVFNFLSDEGKVVCLIKPQFEAGKEFVGKHGVVRDKLVHESVIKSIIDFASNINYHINNLDFSPVKGPQGNIEYLLYLSKSDKQTGDISNVNIENLVNDSHNKLD